MADLESLWKSLPPALGKIIQESCCSLERLEEIRLRLGQPRKRRMDSLYGKKRQEKTCFFKL